MLAQNERWTYDNQEIEIVQLLNYLGVVFSCGGSLMQATKTLADKALKSVYALLETIRETKVPINVMFHLFDSLVGSILHYGWEFSNAECIERVHRKFCKWIINVKMSTNSNALCNELGRYPLFIEQQIRIIKYWFKLLNDFNPNCILKSVYNSMKVQTENDLNAMLWTTKVKDLLQKKMVLLKYGISLTQSILNYFYYY